jgi:predicted nicotinamide N-methyase
MWAGSVICVSQKDEAASQASQAVAAEAQAQAFVRAATAVTRLAFVPEVRLRLAQAPWGLWRECQRRARGAYPVPPPFWAFAWPGSLALARYMLDEPRAVAGRRVYDFGSGGGLAAIAAIKAGAASVVAVDLDPLAAAILPLNAELNGVRGIEVRVQDPTDRPEVDAEVVLAGDVCYDSEPSPRIIAWLRALARLGKTVILAEPGRAYAPVAGLEHLAVYDVPTSRELESEEHMRTTLWKMLPT